MIVDIGSPSPKGFAFLQELDKLISKICFENWHYCQWASVGGQLLHQQKIAIAGIHCLVNCTEEMPKLIHPRISFIRCWYIFQQWPDFCLGSTSQKFPVGQELDEHSVLIFWTLKLHCALKSLVQTKLFFVLVQFFNPIWCTGPGDFVTNEGGGSEKHT